MTRQASAGRTTKETSVRVELTLDGSGHYDVQTPIGFLSHMLEQLARHACFDIAVRATGDVHIDGHHTTEDVAITLGKALSDALGDRVGIRRYGSAMLPMDEACVSVAIDLGGRPFFVSKLDLPKAKVGDFDSELCDVFLEGLARGAQCNIHAYRHSGDNLHHCIEVTFKALAHALRAAVALDARLPHLLPSTKGTLTE